MGFFDGGFSSIFSGAASLFGQESANSANAAIAERNNATSIDLANTSHQREVKDLIAAGLNPVLSAKLGGSATPPMQGAVMQNSLGDAVSSAILLIKHLSKVRLLILRFL